MGIGSVAGEVGTSGFGGSVAAQGAGVGLGSIMGGLGAAVNLYSSIVGANAAREAAERQYALSSLQAKEVQDRNEINNFLLNRRALKHVGLQKVQIAGSGRAQDATTNAINEEVMVEAGEQASRNTRAAEWEASMIMSTASSRVESAEDIHTAKIIGAIGTGVMNAADIYSNMSGAQRKAGAKAINSVGDFLAEGAKGIGSGVSSFFADEYDKGVQNYRNKFWDNRA